METLNISEREFSQLFKKPYHIFVSASFNSMNRNKCDQLYFLIFKDSKVRLGIILGSRNNALLSPFSAPFGGFLYLNENIRLSQIDQALTALEIWSRKQNFSEIHITLPPSFYNETFISKQSNSLIRAGYALQNLDLNYQIPLNKINESYLSNIWHNARKNYKKAVKNPLHFEKVGKDDYLTVYETIKINRLKRGFPLKMTWKNMKDTIQIVGADFFRVFMSDETIAAAIVFHVADHVVQIIYWGDLPEYSECKTMNFLSYELFHYYKEQGVQFIDIGPSTDESTPNHGLCEFKESIGCDISPKLSFNKIVI